MIKYIRLPYFRVKRQKHFRYNTGFTLIELIITITVFTIGILATFGLSLSNFNNAKDNSNGVMASNLAREGIELVRNIRDSNWLKVDNNVICGSSACVWDSDILRREFVRFDYDSFSSGEAIDICNGLADITTCLDNCYDGGCRLYINPNGFYTHSNDAGSIASNMSRVVSIESICFKEGMADFLASPVDGACQTAVSDSVKVGVKVTAQVRWDRLNKTNYFTAADYLYNWRR